MTSQFPRVRDLGATSLGGSDSGVSWDCRQARSTGIWRLNRGWTIHPEHIHTVGSGPTGFRVGASLPCLHRPSECSWDMTADFLNEWSRHSERESTWHGSHRVFWNLLLEVKSNYFCCLLWVTQTNSDTLWEGTMQRWDRQGAGTRRGPLGGRLPPSPVIAETPQQENWGLRNLKLQSWRTMVVNESTKVLIDKFLLLLK